MKSTPLCFPEKVLNQHAAVLGKTGAGKSSAVRHVVEHLLSHNKRVCIVDPKGDWWGLKLSADGKGNGFPVITFGDFKGDFEADVPVNKTSGKHVAELITSGNRPCIIGFRGWFTADMLHFWIDFSKTLFHSNEGELFLIIDEAQNFAPKGSLKSIEGQGGTALHWTNRLLAEGRGLGINIWVCSQRPQKVHNDTLDGCETLVAMRVVHPAARSAIKDWIEGAEDKEKGKQVLDSIGGMKRGEAIIWSPEIEFGPERVTFPMFTTFDSFAPPQLQKKVSKKTWDDVNLDEVRQKLSAVIEEAKANDPKELRAQVANLQRELQSVQRHTESQPAKVETKEIPVLKDDERSALLHLDEVLGSLDFQQIVDSLGVIRRHIVNPSLPKPADVRGIFARSSLTAEPVRRPVVTNQNPVSAPSSNGSSDVPSGGIRRMMIALAQRSGLSAKQLGVRAGLSSSSGTFGTYLAKLRSNGWLEGDRNSMRLTEDGLVALGLYDPLPTGRELFEHWMAELGDSGAARILRALYEAYPNALSKEEIGQLAEISHTSGTFGTYLSRLRTLELVQNSSGGIKASDEFFQ